MKEFLTHHSYLSKSMAPIEHSNLINN
uniref:Uncharacterized protein n=1 Tax=Arundo donax TaxID=35708 RepID=A0A0A8ZF26_ARUDO